MVESRIKSINNHAPIFRTENSLIDPKELINIGSFDLERTLEMDPEFLDTDAEHEHDQSVTSTSARFEGDELNVNKLERWIGDIDERQGRRPIQLQGRSVCKRNGRKIRFPRSPHAVWWGLQRRNRIVERRRNSRMQIRFHRTKPRPQGSARWTHGMHG